MAWFGDVGGFLEGMGFTMDYIDMVERPVEVWYRYCALSMIRLFRFTGTKAKMDSSRLLPQRRGSTKGICRK